MAAEGGSEGIGAPNAPQNGLSLQDLERDALGKADDDQAQRWHSHESEGSPDSARPGSADSHARTRGADLGRSEGT